MKIQQDFSFRFNLNHYMNVRAAREAYNLPTNTNQKLNNHPLVGRKLQKYNGDIYNIEGVYKHWYQGWYICLLIEHNKSHVQCFWEDICCYNEIILRGIDDDRQRFTLIGEK